VLVLVKVARAVRAVRERRSPPLRLPLQAPEIPLSGQNRLPHNLRL
jgi:hypothetical protein